MVMFHTYVEKTKGKWVILSPICSMIFLRSPQASHSNGGDIDQHQGGVLVQNYPLVNEPSPGKITMLIGKSAINRQFSIIMLVYQRVEGNLGGNPTAGFQEPLSPCFIRFPASRVPSSEAVCDLRHHRQWGRNKNMPPQIIQHVQV